VVLLCAAIVATLLLANLLSKAGAEPAPIQMDDRGFISTIARCEKPKSALAMGRTEQSLVAMCVDPSGHYEYRGVRIRDNSGLSVPNAVTLGGKYVAKNEDFEYIFSAKELMILQGWGWVIRKEPMVAFVEPRESAGG
jgi:RNA:NAD 2'-phosphotransferase (TPT1/KptA family)